jgi:D-serine deaminase-like pyridoxal phosphate-dependent protein
VAQLIPGLTENAWVRVDGDQMESLMGQHVRLRGAVVDSGANTIGTAGVAGYEGHASDTSQADSDRHYAEKQKLEAGRIARESLANGSAAKLRVLNVERTGRGNCQAPQAAPTRDSR